jgi:glycosyltransferase involved in cell wall biosynthesis
LNILIINHYAGNPDLGMAFRPYYIARECTKLGHNVTIAGASYSHLRKEQPVLSKKFKVDEYHGIRYIWFRTPPYQTSLKRIFNILTFVKQLLFNLKFIRDVSKPDIVVASSTYPLDIFPAWLISKKTGARLCFEVHDLWPLSPMVIGGYSKFHPFILVMQIAENFAYKKSDVVISFLDKALPHMVEHGLDPAKFRVIPNGYSAEEWNGESMPVPADHEKVLSELKSEGKIIIGYAGGHALSNALDTFLKAAKILESETSLAFVLVGNGPIKAELQQIAASEKQKNVWFLGPVPKRSMPELIRHFDIAYMGGVRSVLHKYGTSYNKMTDYMLSAKPIIFSVDEPGSLIEKLGCGIVVSAEDPEMVSSAVKKLVSLTDDERKEMGLKGKNYAEKELEYSVLTQKFLDVVSK